MTTPLARVAPFLFVLLWSTGFIGARLGLPHIEPLTFLLIRYLAVLACMMAIAMLTRAPWPATAAAWWHIGVSGLLVHAVYLGGVFIAIGKGLPAGVTSLVVGVQPLLTAMGAGWLLGTQVTRRQWLGLVLGFGGVALVVAGKLGAEFSASALVPAVVALLGITAGTLYQKRFCPQFDLRTGTVIQFGASLLVVLPLAVWLEGLRPDFAAVQWTAHMIGALLWSVLGLSIGAIFLLFALIRRSHATEVTSLMYLTPPTTALMAWLMFGEAFNVLGILGMGLAVTGVIFVVKKPR